MINQGYELVDIFIEKGESAKTTQRTQLNKMWDFCAKKSNDIKFIVAYKVDRIARNRDDYRELNLRKTRFGVKFRYVSELFDDTPAGKFMEDMFANMAHFDNDVRTERAVSGSREAMKQGRYVWRAPLGYSNAVVEGKSTIVQNGFAPLILETFKELETGLYSTEEVRIRMAGKGLVNNKKLPLTKSYYHRLIRNKVYAGWIEKFGETHKGTFKPIVSDALFESVQFRLNGRKNKIKIYNKENPDFPLRQFVRNHNGLKLKGYWSKGKNKKYPYYSFGIKGTVVSKSNLEEDFKEVLDCYQFDEMHLEVFKDNLLYHFGKSKKAEENTIISIDAKIHDLYSQMRHFSINEQKGIIDETLLKIHLSELTEQVRKLEKQKDLQSKEEELNIQELLNAATDFLKNPFRLWNTSKPITKRKLQVFVFPHGLISENLILRTPKLCRLFKVKSEIEEQFSSIVRDRELETNTSFRRSFLNNKNLFKNEAYWQEILGELIALEDVVSNSN